MNASPGRSQVKRIALLALAYGLFGWLGLQLAVPPGYATVIWPASGLAVAALLFYGQRLWPGVLIGSFAVNAAVGGAVDAGGPHLAAILVAAAIAVGSTVQAVVASHLVGRRFGIPLNLRSVADLLLLLLWAGPLPCLIAASVGVATLYAAGLMPYAALATNWMTWWIGDVAGILVVLPIALVSPWRSWSLRWSGRPVASFTTTSLIALVVPLSLTFYAWKLTSEATYERNLAAFTVLAKDSQQALLHRLTSYKQSLDAGAGLFNSAEDVSLAQWKSFVDELEIDRNLPGINGLGFIMAVEPGRLEPFVAELAADGVLGLTIHPEVTAPESFVIKYIEPIGPNIQAVGLNIAFEENRRQAATHARDSGQPTITRRIFLVQDATKSAGFLLLRPLYDPAMPLATVEDRRRAFKGWIYAPFVGHRFMQGLTASQGIGVDISVFDGTAADGEQLIYSSRSSAGASEDPVFRVSRVLSVMEQKWTVSWESTPGFEASVASQEPTLVLVGGISLTLLFGVLLFSYARREEEVRKTVDLKTREIAARERQNRSIVDTAVSGFVILDGAGTVRSVNRAAEMIFGFSSAEIVGRPVSLLLGDLPEDETDPAGEEAGPTAPRLAKARTKTGEELYLNLQRNHWRTESGDLRHTLIISDVTIQQRATRALEVSERRWKYALEGARIGVFDINLGTGRSFVSDTWKSMLGFALDEVIEPQREWLSRVHPEDMVAVRIQDEACIAGRAERSQSEYRIRRKDGTWIWLRSDAVVIERDAAGIATRMIGTQADITALKEAEAALRSSEERFRLAIEGAPVGMALIDGDGGWLQINDALCCLLGYASEELLEIDLSAITYRDESEPDLDLAAALVEQSVPTYQIEKRFVHKSGRAIWCLFSVSLVRDHHKDAGYFVAQFQDINDRKEMDRLKGEFVATVSHELRTPLTSIRGSLGLVKAMLGDEAAPKAVHLLGIAMKNCERLVELINDILDLEKIESGAMVFERRTENLQALVEQAIEANDAYFKKYQVGTALTAERDCLVEVDPGRLQQVLSNLLSNAAKFSPSGGTIAIAIAVSDGVARVSVADQGSGIPPEFQGKIFGRFSQADSSATRQKGGTGLGLHISKQIVEQMGGEIDYRNVAGSGAEFWITLPVADAPSAHLPDYARSASDMADEDATLPTALHVEDDGDFNDILSALLKGKVNLVRAASLAHARAMLSAHEFDLLILDLALPDGSGLELLDEMTEAASKMPVIVVSAAELDGDPRVRDAIVKSRFPEAVLVQTILDAVEPPRGERRRGDRRSA